MSKKRDTGFKTLKRGYELVFKKWGEYMKRAQLAERKVQKLKSLLLLVDPAVSNIEVSSTTLRQWNEFIKEFPDEGEPK